MLYHIEPVSFMVNKINKAKRKHSAEKSLPLQIHITLHTNTFNMFLYFSTHFINRAIDVQSKKFYCFQSKRVTRTR